MTRVDFLKTLAGGMLALPVALKTKDDPSIACDEVVWLDEAILAEKKPPRRQVYFRYDGTIWSLDSTGWHRII